MYFDDGDSVDLSDNEEEVREQMNRLEDGAFDKYTAYLDVAQLNLEVGCFFLRPSVDLKHRVFSRPFKPQELEHYGRGERATVCKRG